MNRNPRMNSKPRLLMLLLTAALALALGGCSDDDDPVAPSTGETFTVTIENVTAARDFFGSGSFAIPAGASMPGPIGPGGAYEVQFGAAPGQRLSFATMMVQSNDLFYAPDEDGIELYPGGNPLTGDLTDQLRLWDAGTELNEEPGLGPNQAPRQGAPDTGPADSDNSVRLVDDGYAYPDVAAVIKASLSYQGEGLFTLRIENVSTAQTLQPSSGPSLPVPLSPGVIVIHTGSAPLFTAGMAERSEGLEHLAEDGDIGALAAAIADRSGLVSPLAPGAYAVHDAGMPIFTSGMADAGRGLEAAAEDGDPSGLAAYLESLDEVSAAGAFTIPEGESSAGPLFPGHSFRFTVSAVPGDRLSLATMLGQSNDLFFGFGDLGLALFDGSGEAVTGDVTAQLRLWDAGTEQNQWPGAGPDQAPRQSAADTGADDSDPAVRPVSDGFEYPAVSDVVRVTITVQ